VKCYIFDIGTVLISRGINKFFSIRNVGNTDLTRVAWCGEPVQLSVLISSTEQFAFQSCNFFLGGKLNPAA